MDIKSTTKTTEQNSHFLHLLKSAQGTIGKHKLCGRMVLVWKNSGPDLVRYLNWTAS